MSELASATISALTIYPVKSCAGVSLQHTRVFETGLEHDRRWMLIKPDGYFVTQRELPRMALVQPALHNNGIALHAPGMQVVYVSGTDVSKSKEVAIWRDCCLAYDEGDDAADWFSSFLQQPLRLVRFNDERIRLSNREWTGEVHAPNRFSDGFPILVISTASLADLNSRLLTPLPMNRFRPNVVIDGVGPYTEDLTSRLQSGAVGLRMVKPCVRCKITTTDQETGTVAGDEPLLALIKYRRDLLLKGVTFGQNAMVISGAGTTLRVGDACSLELHAAPDGPA